MTLFYDEVRTYVCGNYRQTFSARRGVLLLCCVPNTASTAARTFTITLLQYINRCLAHKPSRKAKKQ